MTPWVDSEACPRSRNRKPRRLASVLTRSRVSGRSFPRPFRAFDAVPSVTPAARATSSRVTLGAVAIRADGALSSGKGMALVPLLHPLLRFSQGKFFLNKWETCLGGRSIPEAKRKVKGRVFDRSVPKIAGLIYMRLYFSLKLWYDSCRDD